MRAPLRRCAGGAAWSDDIELRFRGLGGGELRLRRVASLCTRRPRAAEFSEEVAPPNVFRHEPEARRRPSRDSCTPSNRAAVLFRIGAPEGRSLALPFHISSRAKARRDRDESSQADSLRRPALRGVVSRARRRVCHCRDSFPCQRCWADRNGFVQQLSSSLGKAMPRLHGSFSYERRPQSKPVASTIFPLALRANSSRKTKLPPLRVRRFALASRRRRRFGSIGSCGAHHGKPSQTGHRLNDGELK